MMLWINILSLNDPKMVPHLESLSKSPSVSVFSTEEGRVIGHTVRYEVRDAVDLWSEVELEDQSKPFERAAGVLAQQEDSFKLMSVLATNMSRDEIRSMV